MDAPGRDEKGRCVAPACGAETPSPYHHICEVCRTRVEDAMRHARPSLMEAMVAERAEAEAWLAADWAPPRRWVIADDEYHPEPVDDVVKHMVEATVDARGAPYLGFIDDGAHERVERWKLEQSPPYAALPPTAWLVPSDSETAQAWRAHLAPLIRAALEQALASFPLRYAGREIKHAIMHHPDYAPNSSGDEFEELWEGTGPTGLSDGAEDYLELRYYPNEAWMCDVDFKPQLWQRYRVLPDDVQAILDAYVAAETEQGLIGGDDGPEDH
jgi:hypothetical protein